MSAVVDSLEIAACARLSFSQYLRKGNPTRSFSHGHDLRGLAKLSCLPEAGAVFAPAFNSGNSSLLADCGRLEASRLSNLGEQTRVGTSPLQMLIGSKRRARTFSRDLQLASSRDAVETRTVQVKLGANHVASHPQSILVCRHGSATAEASSNS